MPTPAPVRFLGYAPDAERTTQGVMLECSNMVPSLRGMKACPSNVASTYPASSEAATGAALLVKLDASVRFFIGGATKLQEGISGAWTDRSRGAGYTAGDNRWRFAQFGNDSLAANKTCVLQRSTGAAFADLTAPKSDLAEIVSGFVALANCDDTGSGLATGFGDQPDRVWFSGYNDDTTWTPALSTQCVSMRLVDAPGPIRALRRLGGNLIAYKDKAIFIGTYVGPSAPVWQWNLIPGEVGCSSQECVVNIGTAHLFIGETDIYSFDGSRPTPLGAPVREWFFSSLNRSYQYKIAALHDRVNGLVYWWFPSTASASGVLDMAIVYAYRSQRWGVVSRSVEMPIEVVNGAITYDGLGSLFSTYADLPAIAYDSPFWIASTPIPAVISTDHRPYTLTGAAGSWNFATQYFGDEQTLSLVSRVNVRWLTKPASASLTPRYGADEAGALTAGTAASMSAATGRFDFLRSARWHQFAVAGSGDAELVGIEPQIQADGSE